MKVIALTLTTLCLVAATQANWDLQLQCTRDEIGIRWPSYYSNSDYYMCQREGGRQLKYSCPAGEVFTFVLQSCAPPSKFIPPPPINILPTSPPVSSSLPIHSGPVLPKPIHKPHEEDSMRPPVIVSENPLPSFESPVPHPPVVIDEVHHPEHPVEEISQEEKPEAPIKPAAPSLPGKPKPQIPSLPAKPAGKPEKAPLPPTPAPTPPVVPVDQPPKKKQPPSLPAAGKKQPPSKPAGKKPAPQPAGKKQPPQPAGKKPVPVPPGKA